MIARHLSFSDRAEAGRALAERIVAMAPERPVVYALPRGGVPVALEIARALHAPLDLVLVRKIGAPGHPEVALGAVIDGDDPTTVVNESVRHASGATDAYLDRERARELAELERRRTRYLEGRAPVSAEGRTAIVVDDGLATGATMKAALIALKRQKAARVIVALPVAPVEALPELREQADHVVCLNPTRHFSGVGAFYDDFHQLTDEETVGLLREAREATGGTSDGNSEGGGPVVREVSVPPMGLKGRLAMPEAPRGLVLFAHGSGSGRLSPRNVAVAETLEARGIATLLFDLMTQEEAEDRRNVFDIPLLAERVVAASLWAASEPDLAHLPLGLFGASTGAGAALMAAAEMHDRVAAVVSRGGRPDLAGARLAEVHAPTLLIVGGNDTHVLALNRKALAALDCEKLLRIVPGAGHLFEEPGALEMAAETAAAWFEHHLEPVETPVAAPTAPAAAPPLAEDEIPAAIAAAAEPLPDPDDPAFAAPFDRFAGARVVLLGEASHGTSEFYRARAAITRRLVERHGFTIVALEADWPDAAAIDRDVRHKGERRGATAPFQRFPTWMWRNREMDDVIASLREINAGRPRHRRAGVYGLDLYGMHASMAEVLAYLDRVDPEAASAARRRYGCLAPWSREMAAYGRAALSEGYALCEAPVTRTLLDLLRRRLDYAARDGESFFDAEQNARLVANAERYYRVMYYGAQESWNLRDAHMADTLSRLLDHGGEDAKAVVWAHNSHIGDARVTDMGAERGEHNLGQLCRERFGRDAVLVGFGTDTGTVAAASDWDAPMEIKSVRPSRPDSHGALLHRAGVARFLLDMRSIDARLARALAAPRLERFIGVIYRPETERWSHYSRTALSEEYDAFVWFDETRAVTPMPARAVAGEDETYPFGL